MSVHAQEKSLTTDGKVGLYFVPKTPWEVMRPELHGVVLPL